ncbi:hypothetical protein GCM10011376_27460 [Nocardioides flavus (ex Wang et al. 2016)]|uniref:Uncharacterized protein n=1 Tax=Nocardioides flavus (ex Wang et al. 2016) TaxID=2058780 RepID=A0ABQ3HN25_9ACTN|nr:hypothetical protein [Nocardioides flavus (ex Wang et al. 2016)]GHE18136.1 hypothetical protein GCM10011376_27460 [Nocardioides flavus (ex Wang et al. 2016)]
MSPAGPVHPPAGAATSGTLLAAPVGTAVYAAAPGMLWPLMAAVALLAATVVLLAHRLAGRPAVVQ